MGSSKQLVEHLFGAAYVAVWSSLFLISDQLGELQLMVAMRSIFA
jgi:hypothetical protein